MQQNVQTITEMHNTTGPQIGHAADTRKVSDAVFNGAVHGTSVTLVSNRDDFFSMEHEWNVLARNCKSPIMQFPWYASCLDAFTAQDRLNTVIIRNNGRITAIAPLIVSSNGIMKRMEMLGDSTLCEPSSFLFEDERSLEALIRAIVKMRIPFRSGRLPLNSVENSLMKQLGEDRYSIHLEIGSASPWLSVHGSWDEFEGRITPSKRSALRRSGKKSKKIGNVSMEVVEPEPSRLQPLLERFYDVEHSSWKGRMGTSIRSNPPMKKFFDAYLFRMAEKKMLRLYLMTIAGKCIAAQVAVEFSGTLWLLKVGFDEHVADCSPGIQLMHFMIHDAFSRKVDSIEFLGSDEPWIHMWTDHLHRYSTHRLYPAGVNGLMCLVNDGLNAVAVRLSSYH